MNIWITWIIWFVFGILGARIYNSFIIYDDKIVKYVWNIMIVTCGIFGFVVSVLHWANAKFNK